LNHEPDARKSAQVTDFTPGTTIHLGNPGPNDFSLFCSNRTESITRMNVPRILVLALAAFFSGSVHAQADLAAEPGVSAPCEKDFQKIYTAWLNRTIMAHYLADKGPKGARYMTAAVNFIGSNWPGATPSELLREERSFDLDDVKQPGLLFMIGLVEPPTARRRDAFTKALSLFPDSTYPKFIWFMAAVEADSAIRKANVTTSPAGDALALEYLKEGLNDDSFTPGEMSALRWIFDENDMDVFFRRQEQAVVDAFNSSTKVEPWMKGYIEGVHFINEAWRARGEDWAANVTQQGWQGFETNQASATEYLVKSWNEYPHDPAAARKMIKVCMGDQGAGKSMRTWFDRAVAADFDFSPAYYQYRFGIRPKWGGSYDAMRAFGRECAATGRYDTTVPYELVLTALDISRDANDKGDQFKDPQIADQTLRVLDTYLAQQRPCIHVAFSHTLAAIVADKAGRPDEVKRHMAAIGYKPVKDTLLMQMDDLAQLAAKAQASGTP
jgi:hypothetical protein